MKYLILRGYSYREPLIALFKVVKTTEKRYYVESAKPIETWPKEGQAWGMGISGGYRGTKGYIDKASSKVVMVTDDISDFEFIKKDLSTLLKSEEASNKEIDEAYSKAREQYYDAKNAIRDSTNEAIENLVNLTEDRHDDAAGISSV